MSCEVVGGQIRCELLLKAPIEAVWLAVSTAEGLSSWFPPIVRGDLSAGGKFELVFGDEGQFACEAMVAAVEPKTRFAYRWHPGEDTPLDKYPMEETTLVEFLLEPVGEGTRLTVVESGFDRLPESRREWALGQNTAGWTEELAKIVAKFGGA